MSSILGGPSAATGLIASSSETLVDPIPTSPAFLATPPEAVVEEEPATTGDTSDAGDVSDTRRLVVRLVGGDELELGEFEDRGDAVEAAQELVGRFNSAEASGEWPEIDGRFLRPASVTSIDVLVKN